MIISQELLINYLINFKKRLIEKEAIKILEANQLKVGLILSELPLDLNNLEKRECVEAYITLKDQNSQFVLVNSDNEVNARLYFLGKYADKDHNKYKLILKRNLD